MSYLSHSETGPSEEEAVLEWMSLLVAGGY